MHVKNILELVKYCLKKVNFGDINKVDEEGALILYKELELDEMEFLVFKYGVYTGDKKVSDKAICADGSNPYSSNTLDKAKQKDIHYFKEKYSNYNPEFLDATAESRQALASLFFKRGDKIQISGDNAITVERLDLDTRTSNILRRNNINTVGDIAERLRTYDDCMRLELMNRNCIITLAEAVEEYGIYIPIE